jgi:hypothetical protein
MARVFLRIATTYGIAWLLCFVLHRSGEVSWALAFLTATAAFLALIYRSMGDTVRMGWSRLLHATAN